MEGNKISVVLACVGLVVSLSVSMANAAETLIVGNSTESTSGGITFPDGTTQTTAYTGGAGGGVNLTSPNGSLMVGGTPTAPTVELNKTVTDVFYAPATGSLNYAPASGSANYAPATGSPNYLSKGGGTMTGPLLLPANGLQMANGQIVTSGGSFGYGAAPVSHALFDIGGTFTAPTYTAHLFQVDGTVKSNGGYAQAYLRGINVVPTFDVSAGYANYLVGIETDVRNKTGGNVAHSVVGFNLNGQPTSGVECNVGFGIGVPNQQTSLCNGKYGFYQGDANVQYNYFGANVGIGTPFPSQALTVQGNAVISGSLTAGSIVGSVAGVAGQTLNLNSAVGQPVSIAAAAGAGSGGGVTIAAASAGTASGGSGGSLNLSAGNAMAQGGSGYGNLGPAGNVNISAGSGYNSVGGNVTLTSGGNSPWTLTSPKPPWKGVSPSRHSSKISLTTQNDSESIRPRARQLLSTMKAAMKARDDGRVSAIRMVRSAVKNKEIDLGKELDDREITEVIASLAKQRRESIRLFQEAGRSDLVTKEESELAILLDFLPKQLDRNEIAEIVAIAVAESGAQGLRDMGKVMKIVMPQVSGRADGNAVSEIVREKLS